ncbi:MAG: cysteine desulfurase [Marinilabiliaceae bacterium]|nr:cysteine desulfurase [Marinilabiliaceae bacterium]
MAFDFEKIKNDFPILDQKIYNKQLIYFDNAATSQTPLQVIEAEANVYKTYNSNIHRGVHCLSNKCTEAFEDVRKRTAKFLNARNNFEIIFTKGATESINLVAFSFVNTFLNKGDEIIISEMEHHSNIVPWQLMKQYKGIALKIIPVNEQGELNIEAFQNLLSPKTKLLAITHISNALGTINPIKKLIDIAHNNGTKVLIDGAQAVQHIKVDVQELDCDFYVFSGHKLYGPTGTGVLFGKEDLLNSMIPYQGGGEMIQTVSFEKTTFNELPYKFEAGTPNYAGIIGLGAAIDYINEIGLDNITAYENELHKYAESQLLTIPGLRIIGTAKHKTSVTSFLVDNIHPYDMGMMLDKIGIAVRTGHHCAQPIMDKFKIPGTVRASFAFYNSKDEIDSFVSGVRKVKQMFA